MSISAPSSDVSIEDRKAMRQLKLQMQTSVDGFVAGPNGEMD